MQIRIRIHGDTLEVQPRGTLDADSGAELLQEIAKELAPRARDVALDLDGIDSIAAGALPYVFRIQKHVDGLQRHMSVTAVSEPVQRLFDLTNVTDRLDGVPAESALSHH